MTIQDDLETLRDGHGAIESATYLDMRSGTVLCSSAETRQPQERLDALCAVARDALGGADGDAREAVSLRATEALVFRRSPRDPAEALCLVCAPDADVAKVIGGARGALPGDQP